MDDNQFYAVVWRCIALVIVVITFTAGGCNVNQQEVLKQMVVSGADPIKASCSMGITTSNAVVCSQISIK